MKYCERCNGWDVLSVRNGCDDVPCPLCTIPDESAEYIEPTRKPHEDNFKYIKRLYDWRKRHNENYEKGE